MTIILAALTVVTLLFIVALTVYWTLIFPVYRKKLQFNLEANFDQLRYLVRSGELEVDKDIYPGIHEFLHDAVVASKSEDWIRIVTTSEEEANRRKLKLRNLARQMDDAHKDLRGLVDSTFEQLMRIYIAQRPFMVVALVPLLLCATLLNRGKALIENKEIDFAARALA
jgi:hypothetical protein